MRSRWYELKDSAVSLRKRGYSIRRIEGRLGIPRSTLSEWFRDIKLKPKHKERLLQNWKQALVKARQKSILWHNAQKQGRILQAKSEAEQTLKRIRTTDLGILELALSILYLGEGSKKNCETAIGNSDPLILKFFLLSIKNLYGLDPEKFRYELYLRADQDPQAMRRFWAKELKISLKRFKQINVDQRTSGSKTYPHYKGVCSIRCGTVAIQRKLMYLSRLYCEQIVEKNWAHSSLAERFLDTEEVVGSIPTGPTHAVENYI